MRTYFGRLFEWIHNISMVLVLKQIFGSPRAPVLDKCQGSLIARWPTMTVYI